jgi:adenine-specific DNA-methyltransferase
MNIQVLNSLKTACRIETEGIKYIGSKLKLLPYIFEMVKELPVKSALDGFSGSTRVSQLFAKMGLNTTANDTAVWSEIFAKAYLLNIEQPQYYSKIIDHLNAVKPCHGWFSDYYGGDIDSSEKRPFQLKNTKKTDAVRNEIERMKLSDIEKSVALTSLILALDAVDNTMGHHTSYLSKWSARSYNNLTLKLPKLFVNTTENRVLRNDIFDVVQEPFDLVYLDPPYGSNNEKMPSSRVRYNSYYHLWTSVILNDQPEIFGKARRREDTRDLKSISIFEEYRRNEAGKSIAMDALQKIICKIHAKYVLLSYSSGGRATRDELYDILKTNGTLVSAKEIDHKRNVMSAMRWTNKWTNDGGDGHFEYLFLLKK